jgi:hypothetical protein
MKDTEKERESVKIKNRLSDILQQPSVIPVMHGNMRQDIGLNRMQKVAHILQLLNRDLETYPISGVLCVW